MTTIIHILSDEYLLAFTFHFFFSSGVVTIIIHILSDEYSLALTCPFFSSGVVTIIDIPSVEYSLAFIFPLFLSSEMKIRWHLQFSFSLGGVTTVIHLSCNKYLLSFPFSSLGNVNGGSSISRECSLNLSLLAAGASIAIEIMPSPIS